MFLFEKIEFSFMRLNEKRSSRSLIVFDDLRFSVEDIPIADSLCSESRTNIPHPSTHRERENFLLVPKVDSLLLTVPILVDNLVLRIDRSYSLIEFFPLTFDHFTRRWSDSRCASTELAFVAFRCGHGGIDVQ